MISRHVITNCARWCQSLIPEEERGNYTGKVIFVSPVMKDAEDKGIIVPAGAAMSAATFVLMFYA